MKAIQAERQGPVEEVMKVVTKDAPPAPTGTEIIISVHSAALNPVDWYVCEWGIFAKEWPQVLGCDMAGTVEAVGPDAASKFKKGDRVWAYTSLAEKWSGTLQEQVVVPADLLGAIPDSMSFDEASTLGVGALTAALGLYVGLEADAAGKAGTPILIYGGSSSVGQYGIQLAKQAGRKVVAVASKANHQLMKDLGADVTIDYHDDDWVEQVKAAAPGLTEVLDCIGGDVTAKLAELLGEGAMATTGQTKVPDALADKVKLYSIFLGTAYHDQNRPVIAGYMEQFDSYLKDGTLIPNPVKVWEGGLEKAPDAYVALKSGKVSAGKLVIHVQE